MYTVGINEQTAQNFSQENRKGKDVTSKEDFLFLLTTQMKHQDPMNPTQSSEFTAQLAQFSSLEQMTNMNKKMEQQITLSQSLNNSYLTSLLGSGVEAYGNGFNFQGEPTEIKFNISSQADVKIKIFDEYGKLIETIDFGKKPAGDQKYSWDGTDDKGNSYKSGNYYYEIEATNEKGTVNSLGYTSGTISGIKYDQGSPYLVVNGKLVNLGDVIAFTDND